MIHVEPHVVWQDVPGELVLYDERGNAYHCLDRTGSEVWRLLAHSGDPDAVVDALSQRFDASPEHIAADVHRFIADLRAKGLLVNGTPLTA